MGSSIKVAFPTVAYLVAALPLLSMLICVILSIHLHWESSTATHCKVANYLPSLSAAVGDHTPQRYVWRIGIALHCFIRLVIPFLYRKFYLEAAQSIRGYFIQPIINLACGLNFVENWCLIVITYVSSTENYILHRNAFIGFIGCSMWYMLLSCLLMARLGRSDVSAKNLLSVRLKTALFVVYLTCFVISVYFFWRHNAYCEPGMYSLYALSEYAVVMVNILFHTTAAIDFRGAFVQMGPVALLADGAKVR